MTRNFPLRVIRTRQSSQSGRYFFFLRGDDATFVTRRTKLRSTQEPSLLVLGPCSSLVPPRLTEGKIKIINVSFDAWTFSLTGKRREIN